ncbi:MAG: ATP-binding protein [Cytophagales bacterium]|nr:ATP-binding protein [Cytophagales bacterium]
MGGRLKLFISTFLFIISFCVHSQEIKVGIDPEKPLNSLSMDRWTGKDGLISNNLTSVNQASCNFIWITSFNGFLRFDGVNFKLYDKKNLPFLNSNAFHQSFEDSKGNLWFSSQSSGIIKWSNNRFQQILSGIKSSLSVRCIEEDDSGNIWVGTNNEGVYYLQDTVLVKVDHEELGRTIIMDIEVDDKGRKWFATNSNGIVILDGESIEKISVSDGLNHNTVNKLLRASDGRMYVGTPDGIYCYSESESKRLDLLDGLEINDMFIDDFENLWVGSEQGLYRLHLPTNTFDCFTEEHGLPASQISSLCFDHENSLWLSTKKAGLIRFRDGFFKNITTKDDLSSNNVNIIVEYDNAYYIGCDDGLINVFEENMIQRLDLKSSYYNVGIRDIDFGKNGEILVASYRGLLKIDNGEEHLMDFATYGASNDIRRILRSSDGAIWLATRSSGVIKYMDSNRIEVYDSANGLKADYILALEEGKNGDIFVGTHSGGLSIIQPNGTIKNYPIEGGKSGILIFNMEILEDNSIWIATNIGIYKFENEFFTKINLDENLKAETIFDVVLENKNVWLSSNIGLIKVLKTDLDDFLRGELGVVPGRLFDRYDGMASQECTGATRMTLSGDGKLWVPTLGGVAVLDPSDIDENAKIPNVYVTDLIADFQTIDVTSDKISIEPGMLRYEFYFTSLSYIAPPKIRFKYKLEGIDSDWIDAGTEREAIYTNLPKGNYEFNVIATNNDGIWNEKGASLKFSIQPYFYETIFFYIAVIILIGLIIWGFIVWRVHNISRVNSELRKLNEELDRFVYSASHDLRAPLSSVIGLVEVAKLETSVKGKDKCLSMINDSIHKLDGFINDIIDYSRNQRIEVQAEKVDLDYEVNEVFEELKFLDKDNSIDKIFKCHGDAYFTTDGRRINIILKNLISNSIRYHDFKKDNQFIKVEIRNNGQSALINVEDNGIGIDEEHLDSIFKMFYRADEASKGSGLGLYIVKETVDKLRGKIEVKSEVGQGTTFSICLPSVDSVN